MYNETERIKFFFAHVGTKDKIMKIINNGYHELYIDREKEILSRILREWMHEKLAKSAGGDRKFVGWRSQLSQSRSSGKGKVLLFVGWYVAVMAA